MASPTSSARRALGEMRGNRSDELLVTRIEHRLAWLAVQAERLWGSPGNRGGIPGRWSSPGRWPGWRWPWRGSRGSGCGCLATGAAGWSSGRVIRAPRITRGGPTDRARVGQLKLGPFNSVSNADIAELALRSLTDAATIGTAPMIANGGTQTLGAAGYWLLGRRHFSNRTT